MNDILERLLAEDVHEGEAGSGDQGAAQPHHVEGDLSECGCGHAKHCASPTSSFKNWETLKIYSRLFSFHKKYWAKHCQGHCQKDL
jgi:hypothetical protein